MISLNRNLCHIVALSTFALSLCAEHVTAHVLAVEEGIHELADLCSRANT